MRGVVYKMYVMIINHVIIGFFFTFKDTYLIFMTREFLQVQFIIISWTPEHFELNICKLILNFF